uniref:Tripartite motif-containing protein 44-like n=1 Tax=Nicotiana tabacum TaxID=4097 RepID=A0A1S4DS27_TOBAC|nr:PREDICTED: tripartite motif-containing protein 44-like [Nicotiana tabacum]
MTKPNQTPSKSKSFSKLGYKSNSERAKPMKNVKSSVVFAPPPIFPQPPFTSVSTPLPIVTLIPPSSDVSAPLPTVAPPPLSSDAFAPPPFEEMVAEQSGVHGEEEKEPWDNEGSNESSYSWTDNEEDEETNKEVEVEGEKEHYSEEKKRNNDGESEEEKR